MFLNWKVVKKINLEQSKYGITKAKVKHRWKLEHICNDPIVSLLNISYEEIPGHM